MAVATEDTLELQSPICSPPDSPAHLGVNRRESGYMSSTCDPLEDAYASDEGEDEVRDQFSSSSHCHSTSHHSLETVNYCMQTHFE